MIHKMFFQQHPCNMAYTCCWECLISDLQTKTAHLREKIVEMPSAQLTTGDDETACRFNKNPQWQTRASSSLFVEYSCLKYQVRFKKNSELKMHFRGW